MDAPDCDGSPAGLTFERTNNAYGWVCLAIAGEIDFSNVGAIHARITEILAEPGVAALVVDCGSLQFIDSLGVQTLLVMKRLAADRGLRFSIANTHGKVKRVMETLGVAGLLADAT